MDEQQIAQIIRQAARIVEEAEVTEQLKPTAFRVAAEVLLQDVMSRDATDTGRPVGPPGGLPGQAINEFLASLALSAHTDRFVSMAYYLLRQQGQLTFSVRDIQKLYTLAREPRPKNPAAIAGQCAKRGLLAETGGKLDGLKEWQITKTGEAHVEELLSKRKQR